MEMGSMSDKLFGLEYDSERGDNKSMTRTVLVEVTKRQEDYIAEQLMRLGWTPPENSRWSTTRPNDQDLTTKH